MCELIFQNVPFGFRNTLTLSSLFRVVSFIGSTLQELHLKDLCCHKLLAKLKRKLLGCRKTVRPSSILGIPQD